MNKTIKVLTAVLILAMLATASYLVYTGMTKKDADKEETNENDYTVKELSSESISNIPVPDLDRMVIKDENLSSDDIAIIKKNINSLSNELKADKNQLTAWIDLGIYRKIAGDYEGAIEAWEYAGAIRPENSISFHDLGDLYANYLHQPEKSEENFLQSIHNSPENIQAYLALSDLYAFSFTEKAHLADDILFEGLLKAPKDLSLLFKLADYYVLQDNTKDAKKYFIMARDIAESIGEESAVQRANDGLQSL
jgi:tetratricopeptide (TPR) repeat protein